MTLVTETKTTDSASYVGIAKSVTLQSCKQVSKHPLVSFHTVLALIATCTTLILGIRPPFLLCYRLCSNQLCPHVQLRPASLCCGRLFHIHNKTLSLYAEAYGLCNRSPWFCLVLSCSKDAQWSPQWTLSGCTKMRCYGPSPFWSAASCDQPDPLNGQYEYMHIKTTFMFMHIMALPLTALE